MRTIICRFVIFALLFMGGEGALDVVSSGHPHAEEMAHQGPAATLLSGELDPERVWDGDHCEHCCHGHLVGITSRLFLLVLVFDTGHRRGTTSHLATYAQAPPTPPPNA